MRFAPLLLVLALSSVLVAPATLAATPAATGGPAATSPTVATPDAATPAAPAHSGSASDVAAANGTAAGNGSNQTRVLAIPAPAVQRTDLETTALNLGPAAQFSGNVSAVRMETDAVESYVQRAETDEERGQRILDSLAVVEQRTTALQNRQQAAIRAYNREELTAQEFVVELATIGATADALEARVLLLKERADETDGFDLDRARVPSLQYRLQAFGGPVSDRAVAAIQGTQQPTRLFVTTGPEGYVLTTIDGDTYLREGFRGAVRSRDGSATVTASDAVNVTRQSYPSVFTDPQPDPQAIGSGTTYIVTVPHERGQLTAFVDSGTERVFKESQRVPLSTFVHAGTESNVKSGLRLTLNRTYPGGPLQVNVTDAETGEPVDATVTISQGSDQSTVVGETGDDGKLWTLSPRGSYTVVAIRDGASVVFVETSATEPPALD